jgi:hexulose-6-phosphate isomerase
VILIAQANDQLAFHCRSSNMSSSRLVTRRGFVQATGALAAVALAPNTAATAQSASAPARRQDSSERRILKSLKINMVGDGKSLEEKFRIARDAGFDGIEMDSPGMNVDETLAAIAATGLPVDGTVCSTHWSVRHTSPEAAVRAQALSDLQTAIRDTHAVGGSTALLVVGHGDDGPEAEIWPRAIENISQALPLAAQLGVYIAIENVWNRFLYDHDGNATQTADRYVRFVDELNSPWVGMQFDIGNHWKYGAMGQWIRALGRRVVKLDIKGYSRELQDWTDIGEGDIDWADVRAALDEIGFTGWAAAEVNGGDAERLRQISAQMDRVLQLV